jgi:hypothetical protein
LIDNDEQYLTEIKAVACFFAKVVAACGSDSDPIVFGSLKKELTLNVPNLRDLKAVLYIVQ